MAVEQAVRRASVCTTYGQLLGMYKIGWAVPDGYLDGCVHETWFADGYAERRIEHTIRGGDHERQLDRNLERREEAGPGAADSRADDSVRRPGDAQGGTPPPARLPTHQRVPEGGG